MYSLSFLDLIDLLSFSIGVQNLELNLTQESLDKQTAEIDAKVNAEVDSALTLIQAHLEKQDKKMDKIQKLLEDIKYERLQSNKRDA